MNEDVEIDRILHDIMGDEDYPELSLVDRVEHVGSLLRLYRTENKCLKAENERLNAKLSIMIEMAKIQGGQTNAGLFGAAGRTGQRD